jgi:hypothetical protein
MASTSRPSHGVHFYRDWHPGMMTRNSACRRVRLDITPWQAELRVRLDLLHASDVLLLVVVPIRQFVFDSLYYPFDSFLWQKFGSWCHGTRTYMYVPGHSRIMMYQFKLCVFQETLSCVNVYQYMLACTVTLPELEYAVIWRDIPSYTVPAWDMLIPSPASVLIYTSIHYLPRQEIKKIIWRHMTYRHMTSQIRHMR